MDGINISKHCFYLRFHFCSISLWRRFFLYAIFFFFFVHMSSQRLLQNVQDLPQVQTRWSPITKRGSEQKDSLLTRKLLAICIYLLGMGNQFSSTVCHLEYPSHSMVDSLQGVFGQHKIDSMVFFFFFCMPFIVFCFCIVGFLLILVCLFWFSFFFLLFEMRETNMKLDAWEGWQRVWKEL